MEAASGAFRSLMEAIFNGLNDLRDLVLTASLLSEACLKSTKPVFCLCKVSLSPIIRSRTLTTQEVRLIGLKEARSDAGFPAFRSGTMIAFLHICGQALSFNDRLQIFSRVLSLPSFEEEWRDVAWS